MGMSMISCVCVYIYVFSCFWITCILFAKFFLPMFSIQTDSISQILTNLDKLKNF